MIWRLFKAGPCPLGLPELLTLAHVTTPPDSKALRTLIPAHAAWRYEAFKLPVSAWWLREFLTHRVAQTLNRKQFQDFLDISLRIQGANPANWLGRLLDRIPASLIWVLGAASGASGLELAASRRFSCW